MRWDYRCFAFPKTNKGEITFTHVLPIGAELPIVAVVKPTQAVESNYIRQQQSTDTKVMDVFNELSDIHMASQGLVYSYQDLSDEHDEMAFHR